MIKLQNLDKYFNKGQSNEIHVIDDVTLTLPDKGLVVLLGPSGSGKTTLLNVLGGLDKVKEGTINFDGIEIDKYKSSTWDKIRNQKIGYIFQNYNLLTTQTVYDNIALTLNMVGVYDKEEIDKRVDYILERIGMINYRKRRASQLSGGQQQRVAIARALAKNPQVIIADEPTGNLDSKNTQEVMDIIKRISLNKLVVLVTHEENIANFYGDRIIRIRDGQVKSDTENSSNGSLDVQHETDIYLKDLHSVSSVNDQGNTLDIFSDQKDNKDFNLRLIVKNNTVYVDLKSEKYSKIQLIEPDSEINIYDKKYEELKRDDFNDLEEFDLESVINHDKEYTKHSVFSMKDSMRLAWRKMRNASFFGKLFYIGFIGIAALIATAVGMLNGILHVEPHEFMEGKPVEMIEFRKGDLTYEELIEFMKDDSLNYIEVINEDPNIGEVELDVQLPLVFQSRDNSKSMKSNVVYSDLLTDREISYGRNIQDYDEIVINKRVADDYIENYEYNLLGIDSYDDLLELAVTFKYQSSIGDQYYEMKIVGISDNQNPVTYMKKDTALFAATGFGTYDMFKDDITIDETALTTGDINILIKDGSVPNSEKGDVIDIVNGLELLHAGNYTTTKKVPDVLFYTDELEEYLFKGLYQVSNDSIYVSSDNHTDAIAFLQTKNIKATSLYDTSRTEFLAQELEYNFGMLIYAAVVIGSSAIMYFLVIRSNLLSRIYEVSVYRALGVSKGDIRKMFITEIVMITTITSLIGYLLTSFFIYRVQLLVSDYYPNLYVSPLSIIGGVILIYVVNIVSGLIPVSTLIRKTPAEIMSKYDF